MIQLSFQLKDLFSANQFAGALAAAGIEFDLQQRFCMAKVLTDDLELVKEISLAHDVNSATIHFE